METIPAAQHPTALHPTEIAEIQTAVIEHSSLRVVGGNTKPGLSAHRAYATPLYMSGLSGIIEYDPGEYTITAQAGTPLSEIHAALAEHGQHMPFDPPLLSAGATLGGTIAAGLSGSGRHRYGSLRDFLIGVRFIDGQGRLVRGGGKVVKNAAGFDLPKLMVGSRGEFGVLVEASLKVFPEPPAYGTWTHTFGTLPEALTVLTRLATSQFDLYALDLLVGLSISQPDAPVICARLGGLTNTIDARLAQLRVFGGGGDFGVDSNAGHDPSSPSGAGLWADRRELAWATDAAWLVKSACTLAQARRLENLLNTDDATVRRLYTNATNSVWLAGDMPLERLHSLLQQAQMSGVILRSSAPPSPALATWPAIGHVPDTLFHQRIRQTLDPKARLRS